MTAPTVSPAPLSPAGNPMGFGRMIRKEDARFLRGQGNYVDDVNLPGMLHGAVLRSAYAHARIVSIDTSAAEAHPKVKAVITGKLLEVPAIARWVKKARGTGAIGLEFAALAPDQLATIENYVTAMGGE